MFTTPSLTQAAHPLPLTCTACQEPLDAEEAALPRLRDTAIYCDACYEELFTFPCCWCEENGDVEDQHRLVVVLDAAAAGMPCGVYAVRDHPYYQVRVMGDGRLFPWALAYLGTLPLTLPVSDDGYAIGHLCDACQGRALDDIVGRQGLAWDVR